MGLAPRRCRNHGEADLDLVEETGGCRIGWCEPTREVWTLVVSDEVTDKGRAR